jgi:hypothetical protein
MVPAQQVSGRPMDTNTLTWHGLSGGPEPAACSRLKQSAACRLASRFRHCCRRRTPRATHVRCSALASGGHDHCEQGPTINAVITLNTKALDQARQLDAERKAGNVRGPLHGVPIVVKDNFDTADLPPTAGSQLLRSRTRS